MPIQPFHAPPSTIDAISKALGVVKEVYGIKQAGAQQDMLAAQQANLEQKTAQEGKSADLANKSAEDQASPLSPVSQLARQETLGGLEAYKNSGSLSPERYSAMKTLIEGKPAIPATPDTYDENGDFVKGKPGQEAVPGLSASALNKNPELSALGAFVKGKQSAEAMAAAATTRAGPQNARVEETKNQNSNNAGELFEKDKIISGGKQSINSINKALSILNNPNKPLLSTDLTLAYQDYINSVTQGGVATEGKVKRELPESYDVDWNSIKTRFGEYDDLREDPKAMALVNMLKENSAKVKEDMTDQIEQQAINLSDNFKANTNPKVQQTVMAKLQKYAPNYYKQKFGGSDESQSSSATPETAAPRPVSSDEVNQYAQKYGMSPAKASEWLSAHGHKVGQ